MSSYLVVIKEAFLFFPIVAIIFTLPYVIYNFRKYGSALWLRSLIVYSFILYIICISFLVVLPLPSKEYVSKLTSPRAQLIPFTFIKDLIKEANLSTTNGILAYINNPALFQFMFNILMLLPFGIYLHYYFECSFKKTVLFSFLLSLFFEITQLTGLFFIYPRGYRLFDVDDLLANTLGGLIGYYVAIPVSKLLPTRKEIDSESYKKGQSISLMRRTISYAYDLILCGLLSILLDKLLQITAISIPYLTEIVVLAYFIILPTIKKGQTYGMRITKIKIISDTDEPVRFFQLIIRTILFYLYLVALPYVFTLALYRLNAMNIIGLTVYIIIEIIFFGCFLFSILVLFIHMIMRKSVFYEMLSSTKYKSTIEI